MDNQFYDMFKLGFKRDPGTIMPMKPGVILNMGCGNTHIPDTLGVDHPSNKKAMVKWDADAGQPLHFLSESISGIHCYHFLEHVSDVPWVLSEFQRVLKVGGLINIVVPYYSNQLAIEDLDHKHQFCEGTWKTLFNTGYYDKNLINWRFRLNFNLITGVVERNLCLMSQLEKF